MESEGNSLSLRKDDTSEVSADINSKNATKAVLVEGNLWHAIWIMSWPLLLLMIGNAVVGVVDINLAQVYGASAQAAVGVADQIVFLFVALILSVSIGTNALVSRAFGARDRNLATHTQGQALLLAMTMGLILTGCALLFAGTLMHLFTPDAQVAALSKPYLIIYALYFIPFSFLCIVNAGFRADGDAKTPLMVVLIMTLVNVLGDFWFVYGPLHSLGIKGLAWAGFIASIIGALVAWYKLDRSDLKGSMSKLLPVHQDILVKLVKISVPAAMQRIAWNFSVFALFFTLKHCPAPTAALAAWTIGIRVESFLFMPMFALGQAVSSVVGQNLGAKEDERAYRAGWNVSWVGFWTMLVCGLLLFIYSPQLAAFMTTDPDSVSYTTSYLQMCALAQPLQAMAMIFNGALQGAGDTKVPMWITIGTHWLIRQPLAWILAITYALGPKGVWIAMAFSSAASGLLNFWRYQSRAWERLKL